MNTRSQFGYLGHLWAQWGMATGCIANFEKNQIEVVDFESVDFDYKKIENK